MHGAPPLPASRAYAAFRSARHPGSGSRVRGLLALLVLTLNLAGCAHVQPTPQGGIEALQRPTLDAPLPADLAALHEPPDPRDVGAVLLHSWFLEAAGDPVGALGAVASALAAENAPQNEALRVALWARLARLAWSPVGAERVRDALAAAAPATHPVERVFRTELALQLARQDALREERVLSFDSAPLGAARSWRLIGPVSDFTMLDFDAPHPFEDLIALPDRPMPERAAGVFPMTLIDEGETLSLPGRRAGIHVLESWLTLDAPASLLLMTTGEGAWRIEINGHELLRRPPEEFDAPAARMRALRLEEGTHRVRLVLSADGDARTFGVRLFPVEGTIARFEAEPPGAPTSLAFGAAPLAEPGSQSLSGAWREGAPRARTLLDRLVEAELVTLERGNRNAEDHLDALASERTHPVLTLLQFGLVSQLEGRSSATLRARAIDILRAGLEASPEAAGLRLQLARLLSIQGLDTPALEEVRRALRDRPDMIEGHVLAARLEREAGRHELARRALARAIALNVDHCPLAGESVQLRLERDEPVRRDELPVEWMRCPEVRRVLVQRELMPRGEHEEALRVLEELAWRAPASQTAAEHFLDAARASGDADAIERALSLGGRQAWTPAEVLDLRADLRWAMEGVAPEADMEASLRYEPARMRSHRRVAWRSAMPMLNELRRDARPLVEAWHADPMPEEGEVVFLLYRQAIRYFEDGSAISVVHQVAALQTREALNTFGEVGIPDGTQLLGVRTIKPDGRHLIPDAIGTEDSISLPDLEIGDIIELEYAMSAGPERAGPPGMISPHLFFQREGGPAQRIEFEVWMPASWEDALQVEVLAGAPDPERESCGSDCVALRWEARDVHPPAPESMVPPSEEWSPNVRVAWQRDPANAHRPFQNRVEERTRPDTHIRERAQAVVRGARSDEDRLQRLVRWVHDEIAESGYFFSVSASTTLAEMEGDRAALLIAMLRSLEMDVSVAFVRSLARGEQESALADLSPWDVDVIRVRTEAGTRWIDAGPDHTEIDALAQDLQGRSAIIVWGRDAGARVETPSWPLPEQRRHITMTLRLAEDGSARGEVVETYRGEGARSTRAWLDWTEPAERAQRVEEEYQGAFPGLAVSAFRVEGMSAGDGPLRMHYEVRIPSLLSASEDGLERRISLLRRRLASAWGGRETRTRPMVLSYPFLEALDLRIEAPEGWRVIGSVPERSLQEGMSRFEQSAREGSRGGAFVMRRVIDIPAQRIAPEDYPDFAALLRAIESDVELHLRMEPAR